MKSKRANEAYLLIDHRNSPGISHEFMRANRLAGPAVGGGQVFESAMAICHACGNDIVLNPNRSREREWCMQHDAYLCDMCGLRRKLSGHCVPLQKKLIEIYQKEIRR